MRGDDLLGRPSAEPLLLTKCCPSTETVLYLSDQKSITFHQQTRKTTLKSITLALLANDECRSVRFGLHMSLDDVRDATSRAKKNEIA